MTTLAMLQEKNCAHTRTALTPAELPSYLALLPEWRVDDDMIQRCFDLTNYHETLAFTNAIAAMIHAQDHHPELIITYNRCIVRYNTHSVNEGKGGISENDFICAAKIDAIYQQSRSTLHS